MLSLFFSDRILILNACMKYRLDISEGIDLNKSKECMICYYWYFKDIGYKYQPHVCKKYRDLSMVV